MAYNPEVKVQKYGSVKETLIFAAVGFFVLYLFNKFFDYIFKPLYDSNKDISEKIVQDMEAKQEARDDYLAEVEKDKNDPMYQFQKRFIFKADKYEGDENNAVYSQWYGDWKEGKVLDSYLRWVPPLWDDEDSFTTNFLNYMKIQHALHLKASFTKRMVFLNTIRKYYPEFAASMEGLKEDLIRYSNMNDESDLSKTLNEEILKFGLSEDLAEYLSSLNVSAKTLGKQALFLKECTEKGCSDGVAKMALKNKLSIEKALVIERLGDEGYPIDVGLALVKKEITEKDAQKFLKDLSAMEEIYGEDFNEITYVDGKAVVPSLKASMELLEDLKIQRRAARINRN